MSHLTDIQLVILSNAAQAEDGSVLPLPDCLTINGGAVASVLSSLLRKGLVEERPIDGAGPGATEPRMTGGVPFAACHGQERVWRCVDDGNRFALAITPAGLDAIGIDADDEEDTGTRETGMAPTACSVANAAGGEPPNGARAAYPVTAASAEAHANVVDADTEGACVGVADTGQQTARVDRHCPPISAPAPARPCWSTCSGATARPLQLPVTTIVLHPA